LKGKIIMTKRDLIKYLENARYNKKISAEREYREILRSIKDKALAKLGFDAVAESVQKSLNNALDTYAKWVGANDGKDGVRVKTSYYNHLPALLYDYTKEKGACYRKLLDDQVSIETDDMLQASKDHKKLKEQIEANFNAVVATVEGMKTAKDAAAYLKELGFDLSELEEPPTPVMLAKRVEPRFLLVEQKAA